MVNPAQVQSQIRFALSLSCLPRTHTNRTPVSVTGPRLCRFRARYCLPRGKLSRWQTTTTTGRRASQIYSAHEPQTL